MTQLFTAAVITGTGAAFKLSTKLTAGTPTTARWVEFNVPIGNSAGILIGDSSTSATVGLPVAKGTQFQLPPIPTDTRQGMEDCLYDLTQIFVYVGSSDTVNFIYGR